MLGHFGKNNSQDERYTQVNKNKQKSQLRLRKIPSSLTGCRFVLTRYKFRYINARRIRILGKTPMQCRIHAEFSTPSIAYK
jgi:hypothetical protein